VIRGREEHESFAYGGPAVPAGCDQPLVAPPREALSRGFGLEDLFAIRGLVGQHAAAAGLSEDRVSDLVLAVNELATNAIRHGSGGGTLHLWTRPGRFVCQVSDRGRSDGGRIDDPLAGRRIPSGEVAGGLGLFTVNQLCDLVEVRTSDAGTTVRVHTALY
jgi:anti-sigma regulatory factor (Ser/Thr protein kinase)